jgi:hypothetical protein
MPHQFLSSRIRILSLGVVGGLVVGAATWSVLATGSGEQQRLEGDQLQMRKLKASERPPSVLGALISEATAHPIFTLTTGPGAQPEPVIQVAGLSRTPVHRAALVSVNGGAAAWLSVGQSSAGVTLLDVQASKIVVETPFGQKEVALDDNPSTPAAPSPAAHPPDAPPPGGNQPPARL